MQSTLRYKADTEMWPRWPVFSVTQEFYDDFGRKPRRGWHIAHQNPDTDVRYYAHRLILPLAWLWFWWMYSRWYLERWMRHRIADVPSGQHCRYWYLHIRHIKKWTIRLDRQQPNLRVQLDLLELALSQEIQRRLYEAEADAWATGVLRDNNIPLNPDAPPRN